jgi:hypothetical protein
MPRIVVTHSVKDVKLWASKGDERAEIFAPFATEVVNYVAADGSNKVAVSANVHDMEGMMAFMQTPEAAASMDAHSVLQPLVFHMESSVEP